MSESQSWRRGFAAGFVALGLGLGGQLATGASESEAASGCPLSRQRGAVRFTDRSAVQTETRGLAQRVALAVIGAVLHACS